MTNCYLSVKLDFDAVEAALKEAKYEVDVTKDASTSFGMDAKKVLRASDNNTDDYFYIYMFEKDSTAKIIYESYQMRQNTTISQKEQEIRVYEHFLAEYKDTLKSDEINEFEDNIKELKEEIKEAREDYVFGYHGTLFWYGTADALKDATR